MEAQQARRSRRAGDRGWWGGGGGGMPQRVPRKARSGACCPSASGIGFKIGGLNPRPPLSSKGGGTGLSGSSWSFNVPPLLNFST